MPSRRLQDAYALLRISVNATDAEVKNAYRRLVNQHHPDKLMGQGMPDEVIKIASHKISEIRNAYDRIRKARAGHL